MHYITTTLAALSGAVLASVPWLVLDCIQNLDRYGIGQPMSTGALAVVGLVGLVGAFTIGGER